MNNHTLQKLKDLGNSAYLNVDLLNLELLEAALNNPDNGAINDLANLSERLKYQLASILYVIQNLPND